MAISGVAPCGRGVRSCDAPSRRPTEGHDAPGRTAARTRSRSPNGTRRPAPRCCSSCAGPSSTCRGRQTRRPCRSCSRCSPITSRSARRGSPSPRCSPARTPRCRAEHRELLILRVAWRTRSGYEWAQHSRMGADAGLTAAQIDAIARGACGRGVDAAGADPVDGGRRDDRRPRRRRRHLGGLAAHFEPAEMFELLFLVGGYLCLAGVLNSIGLQGGLPAS